MMFRQGANSYGRGRAVPYVYPDPIAPPALYSTRAQAVNTTTGQVYYLKNANFTDTTPGSITKMLTCLILVQRRTYAQLEDTITVAAGDLQAGSGANLLTGDVISYRSLLVDMMLPSSNSACAAVARVIGQELVDAEGSGTAFARFIAEMNAVLAALGTTGSTWYNPNGLDGPDHSPPTSTNITTPTDMNKIMIELYKYPVMFEVWASGVQFQDMPLTRGGSPITINVELLHPLRVDTGVIGGKTGTTSVANSCHLWKAPSNDVIAISVFNGGSTNRFVDARAIMSQLPIDFPELA